MYLDLGKYGFMGIIDFKKESNEIEYASQLLRYYHIWIYEKCKI